MKVRILLAAVLCASWAAPGLCLEGGASPSVWMREDDELQRLIRLSEKYRTEENWKRLVDAYEKIMAEFPDGVCRRGDEAVYESVFAYCRDRIGKLPQDGMRVYHLLCDQKAMGALDEVRQAGDLGAIERVASSYFHAPAGLAAADLAADILFERAQYASAAGWWEAILVSGQRPGKEAGRLLFKIGLARAFAGDPRGAEAYLARLRGEAPDLAVKVRGEERDAAKFLEGEIAASKAPAPGGRDPRSWPTMYGDSGHGAFAASAPMAILRCWPPKEKAANLDQDVPLAGPPGRYEENPTIAAANKEWRPPSPSSRGFYPAYPTVADGMVYVCDAWSVTAFWLLTGEVAWSSAVQRQGELDPAGAFRKYTGGFCTVEDGRLYAVLGAASAESPSSDPAARGLVPNAVVCCGAKSGKRIWTTLESLRGEELVGESFFFASAPTVARGIALVGGVKVKNLCDYYMLGLDAATGRLLWKTLICSAQGSLPRRSMSLGWPVAASGGYAVYCTNAGAIGCVEAGTGRLQWIWTYGAAGDASTQEPEEEEYDAAPASRTDPVSGGPIVKGSLVMVAPMGSRAYTALDLATGRRIWSYDAEGLAQMLGCDDENVYVVKGDDVVAREIASGKLRWTTPVGGKILRNARGAVAGGALILPTDDSLVRIETASGKRTKRTLLSNPGTEAGNVVALKGILITASARALNVFYDPDEMAREFAGEIQAAPGDPAPYMRLGEILHQSGKYGSAAENFKRCMERSRPEQEFQGVRLRERAARMAAGSMRSLARRLLAAGKAPEAFKAYAEAEDLASNPQERIASRFGAAQALEALGRFQEAAGRLELVIREHRGVLFADPDAESDAAVQAGIAAKRMLAGLLARRGRAAVYGNSDKAAGEIVEKIKGGSPALPPRRDPAIEPPLERKWELQVPGGISIFRTGGIPPGGPIGGRVLTAESGDLVCRDGASGGIEWRLGAAGAKSGACGYFAGERLAICDGRTLRVVDLGTGRELWSAQVPTVGPIRQQIFALPGTAQSGRIAASRPAPAGDAESIGGFLPAWHSANEEHVALVTGDRRHVVLYEASGGEKEWQTAASAGSIVCAPLLLGDILIVQTSDPWALMGLRMEDGAAVFNIPYKPGSFLVAGDEERLILATPDGMAARESSTGKTLWQTQIVPHQMGRGMVASGGARVYVAVGTEKLAALDASSGKIERSDALGGEIQPPLVADRKGLLAWVRSAGELRLAAYDPASGRVSRSDPVSDRPPAAILPTEKYVLAVTAGQGGAGAAEIGILKRDTLESVATCRIDGIRAPGVSCAALGSAIFLASDYRMLALGSREEAAAKERAEELRRKLAENPDDFGARSELLDAILGSGRPEEAIEELSRMLPRPALLGEERFLALYARLDAIRSTLHPEANVPRLQKPPRIDGSIEEWGAPVFDLAGFPNIFLAGRKYGVWKGREDLSGRFFLGWDRKGLYIAAIVADDAHRNNSYGESIWNGDSLLIGIDPLGDGGAVLKSDDAAFALALAEGEERSWTQQMGGEKNSARFAGDFAVKRKGAETIYEVFVPWERLGVEPAAGKRLGFTFIADDDDGFGMDTGLGWTDGLWRGPSSSRFGTIVLGQ